VTVDPKELRRVLGHFATGVTVITTRDIHGIPYGLTANAFMSVSLDPPLALISIDKTAQCYGCFDASKIFTVNFLNDEQEEISRRFATKGVDKFAGLEWRTGSNGAAILAGVVGHVECRVKQAHEGGDHTLIVGEIINAEALGGRPLLFFQGKYQRLPLP